MKVQAAGGTIVHLVGYGDSPIDLSAGAAVTVVMDTPYLLAAARSPIAAGHVLVQRAVAWPRWPT